MHEERESGDIVLFHNDSKYILQALPQILEYYQRAGYRVIPISSSCLRAKRGSIMRAHNIRPAAAFGVNRQ